MRVRLHMLCLMCSYQLISDDNETLLYKIFMTGSMKTNLTNLQNEMLIYFLM